MGRYWSLRVGVSRGAVSLLVVSLAIAARPRTGRAPATIRAAQATTTAPAGTGYRPRGGELGQIFLAAEILGPNEAGSLGLFERGKGICAIPIGESDCYTLSGLPASPTRVGKPGPEGERKS